MLAANATAESMFIIGNKSSFQKTMSIDEIKSIYLMKKKSMADGRKVLPINLPTDNKARETFSQAIFQRSALSLADYWNRMSFRGIKPPLIQSSEQSVEIFVNRVKGAIGYMTKIPNTEKVFVLAKIDSDNNTLFNEQQENK